MFVCGTLRIRSRSTPDTRRLGLWRGILRRACATSRFVMFGCRAGKDFVQRLCKGLPGWSHARRCAANRCRAYTYSIHHADIALGAGPANLKLEGGADSTLQGTAGRAAASCADKFVPLPPGVNQRDAASIFFIVTRSTHRNKRADPCVALRGTAQPCTARSC